MNSVPARLIDESSRILVLTGAGISSFSARACGRDCERSRRPCRLQLGGRACHKARILGFRTFAGLTGSGQRIQACRLAPQKRGGAPLTCVVQERRRLPTFRSSLSMPTPAKRTFFAQSQRDMFSHLPQRGAADWGYKSSKMSRLPLALCVLI